MITKKTWAEFRKTGLLLIINQILHIFGWTICFEIENDAITDVYPARTRFRGFDNKSVSENYQQVTEYLAENIKELQQEASE